MIIYLFYFSWFYFISFNLMKKVGKHLHLHFHYLITMTVVGQPFLLYIIRNVLLLMTLHVTIRQKPPWSSHNSATNLLVLVVSRLEWPAAVGVLQTLQQDADWRATREAAAAAAELHPQQHDCPAPGPQAQHGGQGEAGSLQRPCLHVSHLVVFLQCVHAVPQ